MPPAPPRASARSRRASALATVSRRRRLVVATSIAGLVGHQVAEALVPVVIGATIDRAIVPGDAGALVLWIGVLAALFVTLTWSWRVGRLAGVRVVEHGGLEIRRGLVARMLSPGGFAVRRSPGELLGVAGSDVDRTAGIVWMIGGAAAQLAAILTAAVSLLLISVPLGVLVLVATPILVGGMHVLTAPLERRVDAEQAAAAAAGSTAADLLTGLRTIAGLGAEEAAIARFEVANRASLAASRRAVTAKAAFTAVSLSGAAVLLALVAWAAGSLAAAGVVSVGELVTVLGLAQFIAWPLGALASAGAGLATSRASAKRVDAVLDAPALVEPAAAPAPTAAAARTAVRASRTPARSAAVRFSGLATEHLPALTVEIPAGAIAVMRIDDPAAARELVDVLGGRRPPHAGGFEASGAVLAPPHAAALFAGTLRDNLALHADATDARLRRAAAAAALEDVVGSAPDALDHEVGERGLTLSGGQRQRVALARAYARDADVLVLHEPTSALDSVTEQRIAERLRAERGGRTTILVTASPALVHAADLVIEVPATRAGMAAA